MATPYLVNEGFTGHFKHNTVALLKRSNLISGYALGCASPCEARLSASLNVSLHNRTLHVAGRRRVSAFGVYVHILHFFCYSLRIIT